MKFILISDTHIGNERPAFHQQEPIRSFRSLIPAFSDFIRKNGVEFICHAGDMFDDGSVEQMRMSAEIFRDLPCSVYATPGNHDLLQRDAEKRFPENMPALFPCGTVDYFLVKGGVRFDFLSTHWHEIPYFWDGCHLDSWISETQIRQLKSGPQDLPRILVTHSPVYPASVAQTSFDKPFHPPTPGYDAQILALAHELKIRLILGGHNHLNLCVDDGKTAAVTVSALREVPFEFKVLEYQDGRLTMRTMNLVNEIEERVPYDFDKTHIQGRPHDRSFALTF